MKDIPGYEGKYTADENGNVWNYKKNKILKPYKHVSGYVIYSLGGGKRNVKKGHRIICSTFIPNPENKPYVNHKNGIKNDNSVKNLEWCTASENKIHQFRVLGVGFASKEGKQKGILARSKPVNQYTKDGVFIRSFISPTEASKFLGKKIRSHIINCCKCVKTYNTAGGFKWKFPTPR